MPTWQLITRFYLWDADQLDVITMQHVMLLYAGVAFAVKRLTRFVGRAEGRNDLQRHGGFSLIAGVS